MRKNSPQVPLKNGVNMINEKSTIMPSPAEMIMEMKNTQKELQRVMEIKVSRAIVDDHSDSIELHSRKVELEKKLDQLFMILLGNLKLYEKTVE